MIRVDAPNATSSRRWRSPTTHQRRGIGELLGARLHAPGPPQRGRARRVPRDQQQARRRDPALRAARLPPRALAASVRLRARRRLHGNEGRTGQEAEQSCTRAGSRDSSSIAGPHDLHGAARFWSEALGMATEILPGQEGDTYVKLKVPDERLHIEVQAVDHDSRVHLDIEADDIEAEVKRLEKLGAKRLKKVQTWVVMEAPSGPALLRRAARRTATSSRTRTAGTDDGRTVRESLLHRGPRRSAARDRGRRLRARPRLGDAERPGPDRGGARSRASPRPCRAPTETFLLTALVEAEAIAAQQRRCGTTAVQLVDRGRGAGAAAPAPAPAGHAARAGDPRDRPGIGRRGAGRRAARRHAAARFRQPAAGRQGAGRHGPRARLGDSRRICESVGVPVLLAGGLNPGNAREAFERVAPGGARRLQRLEAQWAPGRGEAPRLLSRHPLTLGRSR